PAEVEVEIEKLDPKVKAERATLEAAGVRLRSAEEALRTARREPPALEQKAATARAALERFDREAARKEAQAASLNDLIGRFEAEFAEHEASLAAITAEAASEGEAGDLAERLAAARAAAGPAREAAAEARAALDVEVRERNGRASRLEALTRDREDWTGRAKAANKRLDGLAQAHAKSQAELARAKAAPETLEIRRAALLDELGVAEARRAKSSDALAGAEHERADADRALRQAEAAASEAREVRASLAAHADAAGQRLIEVTGQIRETARIEPEELAQKLADEAVAIPGDAGGIEAHLYNLERQRDAIGPVNLRAEEEAAEHAGRLSTMQTERSDLTGAIARLREGINELNSEGRDRLLAAFEVINEHFKTLFQ